MKKDVREAPALQQLMGDKFPTENFTQLSTINWGRGSTTEEQAGGSACSSVSKRRKKQQGPKTNLEQDSLKDTCTTTLNRKSDIKNLRDPIARRANSIDSKGERPEVRRRSGWGESSKRKTTKESCRRYCHRSSETLSKRHGAEVGGGYRGRVSSWGGGKRAANGERSPEKERGGKGRHSVDQCWSRSSWVGCYFQKPREG